MIIRDEEIHLCRRIVQYLRESRTTATIKKCVPTPATAIVKRETLK